MGVWELLLTILGWIAVVVVLVIALLVFAGMVTYVVQVLVAARARAKHKREPANHFSDEVITELAEEHLKRTRTLDILGHNSEFMLGVKFALAAKKGNHANRV